MTAKLSELSDDALHFLSRVHDLINASHTAVLGKDISGGEVLARLRWLAELMIIEIDNGEYDVRDAAYELRIDPETGDLRDLEELLKMTAINGGDDTGQEPGSTQAPFDFESVKEKWQNCWDDRQMDMFYCQLQDDNGDLVPKIVASLSEWEFEAAVRWGYPRERLISAVLDAQFERYKAFKPPFRLEHSPPTMQDAQQFWNIVRKLDDES